LKAIQYVRYQKPWELERWVDREDLSDEGILLPRGDRMINSK
jgi:hypothetical protein